MTDPQYTPARPCSAPDCTKPAEPHKRWCAMHRGRLRRHGTLGLARDLPGGVPVPRVPRPPDPDLPGEEWRPVVGWEAVYEISNLGRVRRGGYVLKSRPSHNGGPRAYLSIALCDHERRRSVFVHILVAAAFIGPCPEGKQVNHKDCNRLNARADNLEYLTQSENILYAYEHGYARFGSRHPSARLADDQVREIRRSDLPVRVLAERYGVSRSSIWAIVKRQHWRHLPD